MRKPISYVKGIFSFIFISVNLSFWIIPLSLFAVLKWLMRVPRWQERCYQQMVGIYRITIAIQVWMFKNILAIEFEVETPPTFDANQWYFVVCNHQTWADILVLQAMFYRSAPVLKVLVKKQLQFVPLIGIICWAYDYPFLQRYSRKTLKNNPRLRENDLQKVRDACQKFALSPASILIFLEGTRFTPKKWEQQGQPYQYLLKPKAGGATMILDVMKDKLHRMIDITVVYAKEKPSLWDFFCGNIPKVTILIQEIPMERILASYKTSDDFREHIEQWINQLWQEKDQKIHQIKMQNQKLTTPPQTNT